MSSAREGSKRARWIALGAAVLLVLAALWLNATSPQAEARRQAELRQGEAAEPEAALPPVVSVDAYTVRARDARSTVDVAGVLSASRAVDMAAEVEGRVESVEVDDHAHVEAGQLLVRLDRALPAAAVKRSEASLLRAQATDRLAKLELRRQRDLASRGVTSGADLDRAESQAETAAAQVAESEASLIEARTRLAKTRIEAPFAGVVSAIDVDPGAYLRPGDRIAELADLSEIEIEVGVSEQEILALRDGDPVQVSVDAVPGEWFRGTVARTGRLPDSRTRKYPVPVRVPNPEERLLPGMLGTVRFELGEARSAMRVPKRSVLREFDLEHVFVLEPDVEIAGVATVVRRRVVTTPIGFRPDLVEVRSGLRDGERIAISGVRELREGLRVRTQERRAAEMAGTPQEPPRIEAAREASGS